MKKILSSGLVFAGMLSTPIAVTKADVQKYYGDAGDKLAASGCFITLADNREIVVARKGLTGFVHQLPTAYTIRLKDLKEG